jgi:hypothetical protein
MSIPPQDVFYSQSSGLRSVTCNTTAAHNIIVMRKRREPARSSLPDGFPLDPIDLAAADESRVATHFVNLRPGLSPAYY